MWPCISNKEDLNCKLFWYCHVVISYTIFKYSIGVMKLEFVTSSIKLILMGQILYDLRNKEN